MYIYRNIGGVIRQSRMKKRSTSIFLVGFIMIVFSLCYSVSGQDLSLSDSDAELESVSRQTLEFDLQTEAYVTKEEVNVAASRNGTEHHYVYRVQAVPTATEIPQYLIDPKYSVSYTTTGFQANDTIALRSTNSETDSESPIWIYDVVYVGSGNRTINFTTTGRMVNVVYLAADNEEPGGDDDPHEPTCPRCGCHLQNCETHDCEICNPGGTPVVETEHDNDDNCTNPKCCESPPCCDGGKKCCEVGGSNGGSSSIH